MQIFPKYFHHHFNLKKIVKIFGALPWVFVVPFNSSLNKPMVISGASSPKMMPDIVSVYGMQENKMKVKLNSNIHSNIFSEIMILRENGGCGESLAQISNFHIYMGIAA